LSEHAQSVLRDRVGRLILSTPELRQPDLHVDDRSA
jgi:hypothetical protein